MSSSNRINHSLRDSFAGGRTFPASHGSLSHRRGHSFNGFSSSKDITTTTDENLDLFSKNRRSLSVASSDESSDVSVKLGRLSVGSATKLAKNGIDDLLSSTDGGKHDYDWLLTPPGTPLLPSDGSESQPASLASRNNSLSRSVSTAKASRLSVSHSESYHSTRLARSSSATRSSISSSQFSTYSSNRSSSILNTSSASVSSYTRPSSPITRSPSTARASTPSARPASLRASTPSRVRPAPTSSLSDRSRPSQSSRPSTPTSRPSTPSSRSQVPAANTNSSSTRSNSRPSTPTRRSPAPSVTPVSGRSTSASHVLSTGRVSASTSRSRSPGPLIRRPQQPVVPPDFPLDTPPNLRTTLPDRPLSTGRSRPGATVTMKGSPETSGTSNAPRRHSSPIFSRGRLAEAPGKGRAHSSGQVADISEPRKVSHVSELGLRKPIKSTSTTTEGNGFGRTISKKSLDMAIRHMDIRSGNGSSRALASTTLFPQSIRATTKTQSIRSMHSPEPNNNGDALENGHHANKLVECGSKANENRRYSAKLSQVDVYESSRYDAMLLKEDLRNTNWLHGIDDKSDQGSIFDNGFESLPEPFAPL